MRLVKRTVGVAVALLFLAQLLHSLILLGTTTKVDIGYVYNTSGAMELSNSALSVGDKVNPQPALPKRSLSRDNQQTGAPSKTRRPQQYHEMEIPRPDGFEKLRAEVQAVHARNVAQLPVEGPLYPRWEGEGLDIQTVLDFMRAFELENATTVTYDALFQSFPETPYIVDGSGYYRSGKAKEGTWKIMLRARVYPTEEVARRGLYNKVLESIETASHRWPKLVRALTNGGFPYIAWYGDFLDCNMQNWGNKSVPLFTTCSKVDCPRAIPAPTYRTILDSAETSSDWDEAMLQHRANYPWEQKKNQIAWRGSLSGSLEGNPRWQLCSLVQQTGKPYNSLFDVGLHKIPPRHDIDELNMTEVGGLVDPINPMEDFQNFKAILDIDGNSWSSRFGRLLCYNSVVVKVEPHFVDYFHFKDLRAWKHYVPVDYDLSNLVERTAFVLDPANDDLMQHIVMNANEWCRKRMVRSSIAEDYLEVWENYVDLLDRGNPEWPEIWNKEKPRFLNASLLKMQKISKYHGL